MDDKKKKILIITVASIAFVAVFGIILAVDLSLQGTPNEQWSTSTAQDTSSSSLRNNSPSQQNLQIGNENSTSSTQIPQQSTSPTSTPSPQPTQMQSLSNSMSNKPSSGSSVNAVVPNLDEQARENKQKRDEILNSANENNRLINLTKEFMKKYTTFSYETLQNGSYREELQRHVDQSAIASQDEIGERLSLEWEKNASTWEQYFSVFNKFYDEPTITVVKDQKSDAMYPMVSVNVIVNTTKSAPSEYSSDWQTPTPYFLTYNVEFDPSGNYIRNIRLNDRVAVSEMDGNIELNSSLSSCLD